MKEFEHVAVGQHFMYMAMEWVKLGVGAIKIEWGCDDRVVYLYSTAMVEPLPCKFTQLEVGDLLEGAEIDYHGLLHGFVISGGMVISCEHDGKIVDCNFRAFYDADSWRATREEAEKLLEYRKALHRVMSWKKRRCLSDNGVRRDYQIIYSLECSENLERPVLLVCKSSACLGSAVGGFYSRETAEMCAKEFSESLKIIYTYGA